ncbi:hypothetical protein ACFVT1_19395 [Streptomyces sp. NPDC057963]|uniref:hypothetical protein n=1 Tax=Streptomyces sp. NPDC057963 TaxID=3346290 RepID=UPI0036EF907E
MVQLLVMFGVLTSAVVYLIVVLLRRGNSRTENSDGLLMEQQAREEAKHTRAAFHSVTVHYSMTGRSHKS